MNRFLCYGRSSRHKLTSVHPLGYHGSTPWVSITTVSSRGARRLHCLATEAQQYAVCKDCLEQHFSKKAELSGIEWN
jgi:hypothetical protein